METHHLERLETSVNFIVVHLFDFIHSEDILMMPHFMDY